jgi:hypothetical protein
LRQFKVSDINLGNLKNGLNARQNIYAGQMNFGKNPLRRVSGESERGDAVRPDDEERLTGFPEN